MHCMRTDTARGPWDWGGDIHGHSSPVSSDYAGVSGVCSISHLLVGVGPLRVKHHQLLAGLAAAAAAAAAAQLAIQQEDGGGDNTDHYNDTTRSSN